MTTGKTRELAFYYPNPMWTYGDWIKNLVLCAKRGCDNRGKLGLNIVGHGSFPTKWGRRWRYRCTVCGGTVSTNTGTAVQRPSLVCLRLARNGP